MIIVYQSLLYYVFGREICVFYRENRVFRLIFLSLSIENRKRLIEKSKYKECVDGERHQEKEVKVEAVVVVVGS